MNVGTTFSKEFLVDGIMQVPMGIAVFSVPDFRVKMANPFYLQMVDRSEENLIGQPLFEAVPEIRAVMEPLFHDVLESGTPSVGNEVETSINHKRKREAGYFNFVYQPLKDSDGLVEGIMVVVSDVTETVRAKKRLQEREEKFRLMIARSPIAMVILRGPQYVIEFANDAMLNNLWHRAPGDVKEKKLFDAFPEWKEQMFPDMLMKVFTTGIGQCEKEKPVFIKGSACSHIDFECTPLFDAAGAVTGIQFTAYDVSEKVKGHKKTEENEVRLRMVIEASGLGTWELDLKTKKMTYSDEYLATFGISQNLSHDEFLQFMHPEDLPLRREAFREAFATGRLHYVSRLIWRDKSIHWIEAHGKVVYDEDGVPSKMIGTSRDVTEEKLYQQGIRESEEKFRLLAGSMHQLIWTGDASGNLNYFNQSVFDYSGKTFDELKGQGWMQVIHPDDRAANTGKWLEAVKTGRDFLFEHRFRRHDGMYRWQLSQAMPQYDSQGRIQMWVGTSTDIHDQKTFAKELEEKVFERTRELKETNEALEKTNRELEQFAYIASHDLQEPLRKIQTFADILKRNLHDEVSVKKYFAKIDSSAQRMGDLIKSVLDYSRIPAHPGQLKLADLNEIVENVITDFELKISDKNAVVKCDWLPAVPGVPLQLHQLFSNLISNALKFCRDKPYIRIKARPVPGYELTGLFKAVDIKQYVELLFTDNGIGFDNRYKEQIFTIFQRLHGWQQYSGTGIGLALCKKIIENHQGHITAESEPGKGSTFAVYLPA